MAADGPRILLVEDDEAIGRNLAAGLRSHGFSTTWHRTGSSALVEAESNRFELVLLDLGLPDVDGTDIARDLRQRDPDLLIVMLTARGDDIDVVVGLDIGADDYIIKPVELTVLLARLRAHLRRREGTAGHDQSSLIVRGELRVDTGGRRCRVGSVEVRLRPKEFDLLAELAAHAGTALRREYLMGSVWDEHWFGSTKTLDVTMAALRRRLEEAATTAGLTTQRAPVITTLRGHGYRLDAPGV
jgi:DNA-binding response OmpR family regulator